MRQPQWTKYEAAILLDGYLEVAEKRLPRLQVIRRISSDLRKMANNNGMEIDDVFRNENGISFQMQSMESAYCGTTVTKPATQLFTEVVTLYKDIPEEYIKLLKEARVMIDGKANYKDAFSSWLEKTYPAIPANALLASCNAIEQFCLKLKILKTPLFDTADLDVLKAVQRTVSRNKIFRITNKKQLKWIDTTMGCILGFISEGNLETEEKLSMQAQPNNAEENTTQQPGRDDESTEPYVRTEQDRRLLAKYPHIYKRVFSILQEEKQTGTTIAYLYEQIDHIARCAEIEDILDNVSWSKCVFKRYIFSEEIVSHGTQVEVTDDETLSPAAVTQNEIATNVVDFASSGDYTYTRPIGFSYFEDKVDGLTSWTDLYVRLVSKIFDDYPDVIPIGRSFAGAGRVDFGDVNTARTMTAPKSINAQMYLETNLSAKNMVDKIKALLDTCRVDYENVIIEYQKKTESTAVPRVSASKVGVVSTVAPEKATPSAPQTVADEKYCDVLTQYFQKGFRLGSPLELRKFRRCYEQTFEQALEDDDAQIERSIGICGIRFEDKVFMPQTMLGDDVREKLFAYIRRSFNEGKTALYYQALFNEFSEDFLDYFIYNADMLKAYLSFMLGEEYYFDRSYLSKDASATADPVNEIRICLREYAAPMTYDVMFENLPHIPQQKIKQILASNNEFISNGRGEYFHVSAVHFSDEELDNIAEIITAAIDDKEFLSGNELINAIKAKYPYTYEKNDAFSVVGLRDSIKYYLCRKFSFSGNIISKYGSFLTMSDVFANFCRNRDSFTLDELNVLASELGSTIYFDSVYSNSLRINRDRFVSKARAQFNVPDTDAALDRFCTGEYISIRNVDAYSLFPNAGFPWNEYLLEHYVAAYSEKYTLLHIGFNANACVGAIVKKNAEYENIDDIVVRILADSDILLKKQAALQYLCDEGYIARRMYNNIEELLIRALAQRNRKEAN